MNLKNLYNKFNQHINININTKNNTLCVVFEYDCLEFHLYHVALKNKCIEEAYIIDNYCNLNTISMRDKSNLWFINGISYNSLNKIEHILHFIYDIMLDNNMNILKCFGISLGGFAAILYGKYMAQLHSDVSSNVLAVSPKTCLLRYINHSDVIKYKKNKQHPVLIKNKLDTYSFKKLRHYMWNNSVLTDDNVFNMELLNVLSASHTTNFMCKCICSAENRVDAFHSNRISKYSEIEYLNLRKQT